jgi:predicted RNA-binding protein Jag
MIINKNVEEKVFIHIEINDYMESKDNRLFEFVKSKIDFVEKSGKEVILPFFSAYERKKIHSYV